MAWIEETAAASFRIDEAADGTRHIRRERRPHPLAFGSLGPRERARIITIAWGDRYVSELLELTIPALLAPGNLPAFSRHFDCEYCIVTETRLFDRITTDPAIGDLAAFGDIRLIPIDDLLSPHYGVTLTYALVRGFADLGPAMTETHLVFFNADFIIADGSYEKLASVIKGGARLVVSPSYCMILEETIDALRSRCDPATCVLSLPKRILASLILAHRHNTIRAKTVNQRLFRISRYDQFYWYVDENTLLGRQLPIAVVYMRPERVLTELRTLWDYGVIAEYCPNTEPCVLGDSDDFLMAELRTEGTAREMLHLGWPSVEEIAADLSSFTTKDQRDYGRHSLVLHAADLPAGLNAAKERLAEFVDDVYARLGRPLSHRDHPFWCAQFSRFIKRHREADRNRRARQIAKAKLLNDDPSEAARQQQLDAMRERILSLQVRHTESKSCAADHALTLRRLRHELEDLAEQQRLRIASVIAGSEAPAPRAGTDNANEPERRSTVGRLSDVYARIFGRLPHVSRWHPYHTVLRPTMSAISEMADAPEVLVISSGELLGPAIASSLSGRKLSITPRMLDTEFHRSAFQERTKFDLCICELSFEDLLRFRELFAKLLLVMQTRSRIVVFHHNTARRAFDDFTFQFAGSAFPLAGGSEIILSGSRPGALAQGWLSRALGRHNFSRLRSNIGLAGSLMICAPLARFGCWIEDHRDPQRLPPRCTALTMVIDLP